MKYLVNAKFIIPSGVVLQVDVKAIYSNTKINKVDINFSFQQSDVEFEYKIFVRKDGVYKITYEDLRNAGIELKGVQASKLRIKTMALKYRFMFILAGMGFLTRGIILSFTLSEEKVIIQVGGKIFTTIRLQI